MQHKACVGAVSKEMGRKKIWREEKRNAIKYNMQTANHGCGSLCLQYTALIFALYFIFISFLFGASKVDSPRVEYTGFPFSSVYCPEFLTEAAATFSYLLVFF